MEIETRILQKYYEQAAVEQLMYEYSQKGYELLKEEHIENQCFDLVARKDCEIIVFEIKTGSWNADKRQAVENRRNYAVHKLGAKFKLVLVSLPKEPDIEIEGLEALLPDLLADHFADEFSRLATHYWVDEVSDLMIDEIHLKITETKIKGRGIVTVGFQYGSDIDYSEDNGLRWTDSFWFDFHFVLDEKLEINRIVELEIDIPQEPK